MSALITLTTINGTPGASEAIGPYSQAVVTLNGLIYSSGSIPLDPSTMKVIHPTNVELQTDLTAKKPPLSGFSPAGRAFAFVAVSLPSEEEVEATLLSRAQEAPKDKDKSVVADTF
ncbi:hypothetical protein PtA15_6A890 [Puccinia triticina]|uniref:Uncharacterized protein n=1 Tax=Puccinia triticina TaxID=208348 RepID=A0ABY7CM09_9BASI|nr:uncharacterized protein PtA15_6A890 [Puccinia triticina]WAQ86258.1 hypothetical protein PtA15_6A890 [Puccinia triticina]